jgi:hypothetical protein
MDVPTVIVLVPVCLENAWAGATQRSAATAMSKRRLTTAPG